MKILSHEMNLTESALALSQSNGISSLLGFHEHPLSLRKTRGLQLSYLRVKQEPLEATGAGGHRPASSLPQPAAHLTTRPLVGSCCALRF
jgi:hypothetical protein